VLVSGRHGLFSWHPIILVALAGLAVLFRKDQNLALLLAILFCLEWYVNGAQAHWWADASFGHRRFLSCFPIWVFGLGAFYEELWKRGSGYVMFALSALGVMWNVLLMVQYATRHISNSEAVNLLALYKDQVSFALPKLGFITISILHHKVSWIALPLAILVVWWYFQCHHKTL